MTNRTYTVYKGMKNGQIVYIGTTIQKPADRFRWHRSNGKRFDFEVLSEHSSAEEMLDREFELIKQLQPKYNKMQRKQNLNVRLTQADLDLRVGPTGWCQFCLKRRVSVGYTKCAFCK